MRKEKAFLKCSPCCPTVIPKKCSPCCTTVVPKNPHPLDVVNGVVDQPVVCSSSFLAVWQAVPKKPTPPSDVGQVGVVEYSLPFVPLTSLLLGEGAVVAGTWGLQWHVGRICISISKAVNSIMQVQVAPSCAVTVSSCWHIWPKDKNTVFSWSQAINSINSCSKTNNSNNKFVN